MLMFLFAVYNFTSKNKKLGRPRWHYHLLWPILHHQTTKTQTNGALDLPNWQRGPAPSNPTMWWRMTSYLCKLHIRKITNRPMEQEISIGNPSFLGVFLFFWWTHWSSLLLLGGSRINESRKFPIDDGENNLRWKPCLEIMNLYIF